MNDTQWTGLEKANGLGPARRTVGPQGAGSEAGRPTLPWRHAGARLPSRPGFEAEGSPLLAQLITRDNGARPCPACAFGWQGASGGRWEEGAERLPVCLRAQDTPLVLHSSPS